MPNTEYYVEFTVGATGSPAGYGFQATAVFANGSNAGTFIDCTSNAQLEDVGGRHIVEQNDLSPSNTFGLYWGAPDGERARSPSMPACWRATVRTATAAIPSAARASRSMRPSRTSNAPTASTPDEPNRIWATEYSVFVENTTYMTLDAFAVDGRWLRSINLPAGRHTLSTADWGVRGLVIAQFSGVDARGQTVLHTQRFWAH